MAGDARLALVHVPDSTVTAADLADPARYALYSGQILHAKPYLFFRPQAALNPEQAEFLTGFGPTAGAGWRGRLALVGADSRYAGGGV